MDETALTNTPHLSSRPIEAVSLSEREEYCDVCFIAFGSQEPRKRKADKVAHYDCANRL